jgi:hypothetical protein
MQAEINKSRLGFSNANRQNRGEFTGNKQDGLKMLCQTYA